LIETEYDLQSTYIVVAFSVHFIRSRSSLTTSVFANPDSLQNLLYCTVFCISPTRLWI